MELYGASPPELFGALWSSPEFSFLIETFTGLMFRNTYESLQIVSLSFLISSERLPSPSWTQNNQTKLLIAEHRSSNSNQTTSPGKSDRAPPRAGGVPLEIWTKPLPILVALTDHQVQQQVEQEVQLPRPENDPGGQISSLDINKVLHGRDWETRRHPVTCQAYFGSAERELQRSSR